MKNTKYILLRTLLLLLLVGAGTACDNDQEEVILDNQLSILQQQINGEEVEDGISDVSTIIQVQLVFSHELNTSAFEAALGFSGPNGSVAYSLDYSVSNSFVTITPDEQLDFESEYSISLSAGAYGANDEELMGDYQLSFRTAPFVPANITLSTDLTTLSEAGETATIGIDLSMPIEQAVEVELALQGTATAGSDYTASTSSITIPAGETERSITITTLQDMDSEGTEFIEISIASITNATELDPQLISITLLDDDADTNNDGVPDQGFIINEVLFDPPGGDAGDANGDGTRSPSEDEFIEFFNDSDIEVDLSGFTLFDDDQLGTGVPRHTFPEATVVPPQGVYVLFGGGSPAGDFGVAQVAASSTGNINLNNADDAITIFDTDGNIFLTFSTQEEGAGLSFGENQSITRNPDINGDYVLHTSANMELDYSPGKKVDGTDFPGSGGADPGQGLIINEVLFDPPSDLPGDANGDGMRSASEDEFIEFYNDSDSPVDLSGFTLFDEDQLATMEPRHTFPDGTVIPAGGVYVLFGGGTPTGDFGGAQVAASSSGNMNLNNSGDAITILDTDGNVFLTFSTDEEGMGLDFGENQSITRSPDITGSYTLHTSVNASLAFSPGTRVDGSVFE